MLRYRKYVRACMGTRFAVVNQLRTRLIAPATAARIENCFNDCYLATVIPRRCLVTTTNHRCLGTNTGSPKVYLQNPQTSFSIGYPSRYNSVHFTRFLATAANETTPPVNVPPQLNALLQWYEDVIGLADVRDAQNKVIEAENDFVRIQAERQHQQSVLNQLQTELRSLSAELDRLNRGDPVFLETITKQHALFREEAAVLEKYHNLQEDERIKFGLLSAAVRESHEKERQRTERTKYWSIIGSIIGALVGMTGAGINSFLRNRRIKELDNTIKSQHQEVQTVLNDVRTRIHGDQGDDAAVLVTNQNGGVSNKDIRIELDNIKQLVVERGGDVAGVEDLVADLEYRMKINSLATVAFIYGAFALTIPILYAIFTK